MFTETTKLLPVILGPNIIGGFGSLGLNAAGGAFYRSYGYYEKVRTGENATVDSILFSASRSSSIYGASNTVQPNALVFNYIIKY